MLSLKKYQEGEGVESESEDGGEEPDECPCPRLDVYPFKRKVTPFA
jgi:hypothetical protein